MYEVWADQSDPSLWTVIKEGGSIPSTGSKLQWTMLGKVRVTDALAREIETTGYSDYQSNGAPFSPDAVLEVRPLLKSI